MILPTKHLSENKAIITVGSIILASLDKPKSVSRLWNDLVETNEKMNGQARLTFDWYVLALDFLYIINAIEIQDGLLRRGAR